MIQHRILPIALLSCLLSAPHVSAASPDSAPAAAKPDASAAAAHDARIGWWREARFGMFIHWGLYSIPAGTFEGKKIPHAGEWIMNWGKIPVARYAEFAKEFNPTRFDADEWVMTAMGAGMKYIIITTKHHEGFALFKTKASSFNMVDATPFKRDVIAELFAACRKHGMKLGFYYSQAQDWHHPGGAALFKGHWDKAQDGSMDDYIDQIAVPQVRELLTNYGEFPSVLWWDSGEADMNKARAAKLYKVVKELKPNLIMNNRLGGGYKGDTLTPEQTIPAEGFKDGCAWETCMTMNGSWGYKPDTEWKKTGLLIFNLVDIVSKGGNYLLNVGPTGMGNFPPEAIERLAAIGKWMNVNGEAIHGAEKSCFGAEYDSGEKDKKGQVIPAKAWRCTTKPGRIYIHLFQWPDGKLELPDVKGGITRAYLLADRGSALTVTREGGKVTISSLPANPPDKIDSVVCLETAN